MDIEQFMSMQRELQVGMKRANPTQGGDPYHMSDEELAQFITWNHTALIVELGEMLNEVGWKPWASSRHCDGIRAIEEMVDAFHFFLNTLLALGAWSGMPVDSVAQIFTQGYQDKNRKNLQRQIEGYDGVGGKCRNCHRDFEEVPSIEIWQTGEFKFCCRACAVEYEYA